MLPTNTPPANLMTVRSQKRKASKARKLRMATQVNIAKANFGGLRVPYSRCDLMLIRKAIEQEWPTEEKAKRLVVEGVRATCNEESASERTRKFAVQTLVLIEQKGWSS